jgi:hypothetical protein
MTLLLPVVNLLPRTIKGRPHVTRDLGSIDTAVELEPSLNGGVITIS